MTFPTTQRFIWFVSLLGLNLLLPNIVQAQVQEQVIEWIEVPGTAIVSEMDPYGEPDIIGRNTIARNRDSINFDAVIRGEYVRYAGNCRTMQLFRLRTGELNSANIPINLAPYSPHEAWFTANSHQRRVLSFACSQRR